MDKEELLRQLGVHDERDIIAIAQAASLLLSVGVALLSSWALGRLVSDARVGLVLGLVVGGVTMFGLLGMTCRRVAPYMSALDVLLKTIVPGLLVIGFGWWGWTYQTSDVIIDNRSQEVWRVGLNGRALTEVGAQAHTKVIVYSGAHEMTITSSRGTERIALTIAPEALRLSARPHAYLVSPGFHTCYYVDTALYGLSYGGSRRPGTRKPATVYEFRKRVDGWFTAPPRQITSDTPVTSRRHVRRAPCGTRPRAY